MLTPPTAAKKTISQDGAFVATSRTKQAIARAKSRKSPMALVNTGAFLESARVVWMLSNYAVLRDQARACQ
jgi:hypothetical protein